MNKSFLILFSKKNAYFTLSASGANQNHKSLGVPGALSDEFARPRRRGSASIRRSLNRDTPLRITDAPDRIGYAR